MREMLESKLQRFEELERQMSDPEVLAVGSKIAAVAREHGSLSKLAIKYRRFKNLVNEIAELSKMSTSPDPDERAMAEAELPGAREKREQLWTRCVMEIRAGVGGEEGALFAHDLFQMYKHHAEKKGWKCEIMEAQPTDMGGFS